MVFGRQIWRMGAGIALLVSAAAGTAEPPEPLTVTRLAASESKLLISTGSTDTAGSERAANDFSRAVGEAVRIQRQSIEAECQSADRATGQVSARWAWEARCRYKRY
jgi:hypothetical protein